MENKSVVCVSGGFDPFHAGHARMLLGAAHFGRLVIILNTDEWLMKRHGYVLMPWSDRKEMLLAIRSVSEVVQVNDDDGTVCEALARIKPTVFANGGLRTKENTPERDLCEKIGIKMVWGIGGACKDDYTKAIRLRILEINKKGL